MRRLSFLILFVAIAGVVVGLGTRPRQGGAAFPGANGKIAFFSERDGGNEEIYLMNADGSGQK
jgi:hypothetical protein